MPRRAAVVIGVGKTGGLVPLESAAPGAKRVAGWLADEGYEVECLHDTDDPVTKTDVEDAIAKFATNPATVHLLLVYFSGHGYWQARSDRWLLSGAPVNTSEAINLDGAMDLARYSGIPTVVFISDACRSIPDSRAGANVQGIDAFPNYAMIDTPSKIDYFKATTDARPAYEGPIEGKVRSVLTHAWMSAYVEPTPEMVSDVPMRGGTIVQVVSNRALEGYLDDKVKEICRALGKDPQRVDSSVPSSEDVYISKVLGHAAPVDVPDAPPEVGDIAAAAADEEIGAPASPGAPVVISPAADRELAAHMPVEAIDHYETETGFTVRGARVGVVLSPDAAQVKRLEKGDGRNEPGLVRVYPGSHAMSVAIAFEDGRSTVLPALQGYIGHVSVDAEGVAGVSYIPSSNHWRWQEYSRKKAELDRLRALVAVAVTHNRFRVRSKEAGKSLAKQIRMGKGYDPSLGLYAAHAYSQAGKDDQVLSVFKYMRIDLDADLFDVRMLASRHIDPAMHPELKTVTFCPILTQSWSLLSARGMVVAPPIAAASAYLTNSLWTTFTAEGTRLVMDAVRQGAVQ